MQCNMSQRQTFSSPHDNACGAQKMLGHVQRFQIKNKAAGAFAPEIRAVFHVNQSTEKIT